MTKERLQALAKNAAIAMRDKNMSIAEKDKLIGPAELDQEPFEVYQEFRDMMITFMRELVKKEKHDS